MNNYTTMIPVHVKDGGVISMALVKTIDREISPGQGRGSKRTGRTGVRTRIVDDLAGSVFVIMNRTIARQLSTPDCLSIAFNDVVDAETFARNWLDSYAEQYDE